MKRKKVIKRGELYKMYTILYKIKTIIGDYNFCLWKGGRNDDKEK